MAETCNTLCDKWNKVGPILSLGHNCIGLVECGLLGLYAIGKYSRVADIQRVAYLRLCFAPLRVVISFKTLFYNQKPAQLPTREGRVLKTAHIVFATTAVFDLALLLHDSKLLSLGKYVSILDRAAKIGFAMGVAATLYAGARTNWGKPKKNPVNPIPILVYGGSMIALSSLTAVVERYSLKFAAIRSLIGIPAHLMAGLVCIGQTISVWCPAKPNEKVVHD